MVSKMQSPESLGWGHMLQLYRAVLCVLHLPMLSVWCLGEMVGEKVLTAKYH